MKAIVKDADVHATKAQWHTSFADGAQVIGQLAKQKVFWHEALEIWGVFGKTLGRGGIERDWNVFGLKPFAFRNNMVVEINPPPSGVDQNLQGIFAIDDAGGRWVLHQGRMSVPGSRITEADFTNATGLQPIEVRFADGTSASYHKVAPLDAPPAVLQERIAAFVAQCAKARLIRTAPSQVLTGLSKVQDWEWGLSPEATGDFEISARSMLTGHHRHGEIWQALSAELTRQNIAHSNDRVAQYGPDIFTYGGLDVLFEIKAGANSHDVFAGVGQLQIYEQLLSAHLQTRGYRKVLVIPQGMRAALEKPLATLDITVVTYQRRGRSIKFDMQTLNKILL